MNKTITYTALISSLIIGNCFSISIQAAIPKQEEKITKQLEHTISDYRITGEKIKDRFEKWIEKDEFEKTINHEARLQKESLQMFSSICMEEIQKQAGYFEIELQKYDADKEHFSVTIQKKLGQVKAGYKWVDKWKTVVNSFLKISIEEAKQLRSHYDNDKTRTLGTNLALVDNNFVATNYLVQTPNRQYELNNPVINTKPIIYSTKSLIINNEKLPFIEFNYSEYKEQSSKTNIKTDVSILQEYESNDVIFTNVEVLPEYPGGIEAF